MTLLLERVSPAPTAAAEARSLRRVLQSHTAGIHDALERLPLMQALMAGPLSPQDYAEYLLGQWQVYAPLEAALATHLPASQAFRLQKADWLADDLRAMGTDVRALAHGDGPMTGLPVSLHTPAHALGVMYVIEGSTLGLQMVRKQVMKHFGTGWPMRFLMAYGAQTAQHWHALLSQLEALPTDQWPDVAESALSTMHWVYHQLQARPRT